MSSGLPAPSLMLLFCHVIIDLSTPYAEAVARKKDF